MIPGTYFTAAKAFISTWWKAGLGFVLGALAFAPLAYCEGKDAARAEYRARAAELAAKAERIARAADATRSQAEALARDRIRKDRKEIDDALAQIPDQAPTDRQRARACIELRRQAAASGAPGPAC